MEKIGVVDWFTKKREDISYPDDSDKKLDVLIEEIIKGFRGNTLEDIANNLYEILKCSNFYENICSDSRLPVCSLFHHSKNTAGIAVCLAVQKADMMPDFKKKCLEQYGITVAGNYSERDFKALIRIGSLLHDIGKPRSFTSQKTNQPFHYHTTQTEEILNNILEKVQPDIVSKYELKKILPKMAAKHHSRDRETVLENMIGKADMIASGADRIYDVECTYDGSKVNVRSLDRIFPHEINFDAGDVQCLDGQHTEIIGYKGTAQRNVKPKSSDDTLMLFKDSIVNGGTIHYSGLEAHISGTIGLLALDIMQIQEYINEADKLPMLRGGSAIVEDSLDKAHQIISKEVCPEAVLFKGGGNLLAFVPSDTEIQNELKKAIIDGVRKISHGGLNSVVAVNVFQLKELTKFHDVLEKMQGEIDKEKNSASTNPIIHPSKRDDVCPLCFKRKAIGVFNNEPMCKVCAEKSNSGRAQKNTNPYLNNDLLRKYGMIAPSQLQEIGESIAVIAIDGNMMGRMFMQTLTPAEYNYKSETFDANFKQEIKDTIRKFIEDKDTRHLMENNRFAGIDPIYVGGDDILLIINGKGAIKFCELLIRNIYNRFLFSKKFFNGKSYENPTVTISCGIAIADAKFPIYFLLETARKMESIAKKEFRKRTNTDNLNLIKLPAGTMAFTAVSGAMHSKDNICFVLPDDDKDLMILNNLISKSFDKLNRSKIASLITCGKTEQERLNFVKSIYSSGSRKQTTPAEWLDDCDWMVKVMGDERLLKSAKMVIPQLWHTGEEI
ncbi:MAG: HD domain-containing protein [Candidatus Methanoperedenaceae archaeon]|nr:HD domain-containing protein [Candidatus Methanoperedenaceae archaeon]